MSLTRSCADTPGGAWNPGTWSGLCAMDGMVADSKSPRTAGCTQAAPWMHVSPERRNGLQKERADRMLWRTTGWADASQNCIPDHAGKRTLRNQS